MVVKKSVGWAKLNWLDLVLFLFFFVFSWFLMAKTFKINSEGNLAIATKAWSDFSATIPLIRSFSLGANFPPQYPIFAGPPIRYHFVFFWAVALLEKIGLPLDLALNGLSTISFFLLTGAVYTLGKEVFKKRSVGFLAVVLFLFNGSFSFIEFFKKHPLSINTPADIVKNEAFPSFGPYDDKVVSAFWNLNIFTNQRHLALAYAAFLFLILLIYKMSRDPKKMTWKKAIFVGIFIGLFPFVHMAVFGMMGIVLIISLLLYPKFRNKILIAGILATFLAIPQYLYMGNSEVAAEFFNPGYLVENLNLLNFLKYWFYNLGLTSILAPIGLFLAKKNQRKIFVLFLTLFIVGNLFQFSPEIAANHKFFNLFIIGTNIFVAYFLVSIWKRNILGKLFSILLLFPLTLTGFIDLFPILNDRLLEIQDIPNNKTAAFIYQSTPKDSVFLNSSFLYDPASLAGRKIYLGWPYFSWSAGYNTEKRHKKMRQVLSTSEKKEACELLTNENLDYVEIQNPTDLENTPINHSFFEENFNRIYFEPKTAISIYDVGISCKNE